ncbi:MAG: hypothetical protein NNA25_12495 [Nitrospira sp.]|nr:hypothetical protein [Nitrospira sp.]
MRRVLSALPLVFLMSSSAYADGMHQHDHHAVPTLKKQVPSRITYGENSATLTFGPLDLPTGHNEGDMGDSIPRFHFQLPEDKYLIGFKSALTTVDGKELPKNYLHHILMINNSKPSLTCPGEPLFFGGAGLEMAETRFPDGYGVKLAKDDRLMTVVAFYHGAPPTKNVVATFTMYFAPKDQHIQELDVYQVGVNIVCFTKFGDRPPDQTDEGIEIKPGVQVHTAPLKFSIDGCVKFAYPHGHDELLMIALENKTKKQTLLRTVPDVERDGTLREFLPHQIYRDSHGFPVNTVDDYEMVMVHHHPLEKSEPQHGMGNYLLYMTRGACPDPNKTAAAH